MIYKLIIGILLSCTLLKISHAQENSEAEGSTLKKGDKLSGICFTNVMNSNVNRICLAQFKSKSIILFSWSIRCGNYPSLFRKINSLQTEFNDSIQILMVNREAFSKTKEFFKTRPRLTKPKVPVIAGDSMLNKIFPDRGYVPCIIMDKNLTIKYFINDYNISKNLITEYLAGRDLRTKEPNNNLQSSASQFIQYQSSLSKCNPSFDVGFTDGKFTEAAKALVAYNCLPIIELVRKAYEQNGRYDFSKPSLYEVHHKDSASFFRPTDMTLYDDWIRERSYSYRLEIPADHYNDRFKLMQEDIERYFSVSVKIKTKPVSCWVLKEGGSGHLLCTNGGSPEDSLLIHTISDPGTASTPIMRNQPYFKFIQRLKYLVETATNMPFISTLDVNCNIDIQFSKETFDERLHIDLLSKELAGYNIVLKKIRVKMPVLIISEK
ncbi:hypothetical protein [Agriterribacter sp.]|uniref:hypothetical protein n=1 Tax=Agriterribacter sp. TaxID=2821509 RepID=UPI002C220F3C|nr:hypothetical protein [Agriterribacter sp.]HRO41707.1 hypothetical protein [Flavipsychrobacter sp.]HRP56438.1 hypothetical protein [Agriterribacter sp.]